MDELKIYYVYQYLRQYTSANAPAGSPYYTGKGNDRRAFDNRHSVPVPKDRDRIVFVAESMNEADAFQLEMLLISLHGRKDIGTGILGNRTDGGEGASGHVHTDETIEKCRQAKIGTKHTDATKAAISLAKTGKMTGVKNHWFGKKFSDEHRLKLSVAHIGKMTGDKNPKFGKKLSDATKANLSLMASKRTGDKNFNFGNRGDKNPLFGKKQSPEHVENGRKAQIRRWAAKRAALAAIEAETLPLAA